MKLYLLIGCLLLLSTTPYCLSFNIQNSRPTRKIRIKYLITKRRLQDTSITRATKKYIDNTMSIIQDDIVNDILYLFKFYNLSNDTLNSYTYIFLYEFISYIVNYDYNIKKDPDHEIKNYQISLFRQSIMRIIIYIIVKNYMINNLLHSLFHIQNGH